MHKEDPHLWTAQALSRHFGVPLPNMQAMLALQQLEAEGFSYDEDLEAIADDVEDYLLPEDLLDLEGKAVLKGHSLAESEPPVHPDLEVMTPRQEQALVLAVMERFGFDASQPEVVTERLESELHTLFQSLSAEQLDSLCDVVREGIGDTIPNESGGGDSETAGGPPPAAPESPVEEESDADSSDKLTLLRALVPSLPAELEEMLAKDPLDFATDLPPTLPRLSAQAEAAAQAADNTATEALAAAKAQTATDDSAVINVGVTAVSPRGLPQYTFEEDLGPDPETYIPKEVLRHLRKVRQVDSADRLDANLAKRAANLEGRKKEEYKGSDTLVFVDTSQRAESRTPESDAKRVWASTKDGSVRPPSAQERRSALLRVQPPQLQPRIKRNW